MVGGDDSQSARAAAGQFGDPRLSYFWDADRCSGVAWSVHYQKQFADLFVNSLPPKSDLRSRIKLWMEHPETQPMWDVAYFFKRGAKWSDPLPAPDAWTKQFGYRNDPSTGESSGTFLRYNSIGALAPSTWTAEFEAGFDLIEK
ncbi:MAG: hypothetical protein HY286_08425 [Planctomycetes bacterium]|nr:hypothetical protein [Planctomycetota bacterium]